MNKTILIFLGCILQLQSFSQAAEDSLNYPRIGQPCPDLVLHDIHYFPKKEAKISDFKGKWLMLIFWNKNCGGCIAHFPSENKMQQELGDKVQVMHIGMKDPEGQVESVYARYRERLKLELPCAFEPVTETSWTFVNGTILIDDRGIVRAKNGYISADEMKAFLSGHPPRLPYDADYSYKFEKDPRVPFNNKQPFLVNGNGGADSNFAYRSLISEYDCMTQHGSESDIDKGLDDGRFQFLQCTVIRLYYYAWYGTAVPPDGKNYSLYPILQLKDSSLFQYSPCKNFFCYSLIMPKSRVTKTRVMHIMRQDLENYFGFKGSIEERQYVVWKLVASQKAKQALKTKGGPMKRAETSHSEDLFVRNYPWEKLFNDIGLIVGTEVRDSTGITGNIDIKLHCSYAIKSEVRKTLHDNGLDLVPMDVTRKVLVIRDADE